MVTNQLSKPFIKLLFSFMGLLTVTILPTLIVYYYSSPTNGMALFIGLLFLYYPLISLLLGVVITRFSTKIWLAPVSIIPLFIFIFAVWYNETAFFYIPFYCGISFIGSAISYYYPKHKKPLSPTGT